MTDSATCGLSEEIFDSAVGIDANAWELVRQPTDVFMDRRLLGVVENSLNSNARLRYLLYRDANRRPVAIAVLCTFVVDIGVLAQDGMSRWLLTKLQRIARRLTDYRILFCGLPLSAGQSSLRFAPGANIAAVLRNLDRTMRRIGRQDRASVLVFKEFADDEFAQLEPLEKLGYRKADSLPTHSLNFRRDDFDGYLKSVGKTSRHSMQRSMRKFAGSGIHFITTRELPVIERLMTSDVHRFYQAVFDRSKNKFEQMPLTFFVEMARQLPESCEFILALQGERVCGFAISLIGGQQYTALYLGLDYSMNSESDLYFNLSIRGIQDAIAHRACTMEMGQNSEEVKRLKFRATPSRRSIYVRGGGVVLDHLLRIFFKHLFPARPLREFGIRPNGQQHSSPLRTASTKYSRPKHEIVANERHKTSDVGTCPACCRSSSI